MYELVIFDFDGTLADTHEKFLKTLNLLANQYAFKQVTAKESHLLRRLSFTEVIKRLEIPFYKLPFVIRSYKKIAYQESESVRLFEHVKEMLCTLRAQKKRLVLLSSNSQSLIETVLKKEACDLFDEVIGDAGLGAKHRALHHVIRKVDISKEKIIYIGDEIRDIKAARACGIKSGVVSFGYTDLDILCLHEPDEIFTSIEELMLV